MATLTRNLRKDLEKTVKQARRIAETGARKVLKQLGVHHHESYGSMTLEQRALRNRLRAHGRQLGDRRDRQKGKQTIERLIQECAYEHWHRMLFSRFLAETNLLIEPQSGVAITLEECQELAREEGVDWLALASDYAERMLPQIFRKDDPVLAVTLPPETRSELEDLLKFLPRDVFAADDSLGWVYQFWQAEKKEEVNRAETKIGADELPAVTQLFTEDYMVLFLLHNTLGAWWAGKMLAGNPTIATSAQSQDELRAACKVSDVEWTYLRFVRDKGEGSVEGPWRPAAGTFEGWPRAAKDLTVLDPCMGSGHFLVFALPILVAFRMAEEGSERDCGRRCRAARQPVRVRDRPALHAARGLQPYLRGLATGGFPRASRFEPRLLGSRYRGDEGGVVEARREGSCGGRSRSEWRPSRHGGKPAHPSAGGADKERARVASRAVCKGSRARQPDRPTPGRRGHLSRRVREARAAVRFDPCGGRYRQST